MADDDSKRALEKALERAQKLLRLAAPGSGASEAERISAALSAVEIIAKNNFVVAEAPVIKRKRKPPPGAAAAAATDHAAAYEAAYRAEYKTVRHERVKREPVSNSVYEEPVPQPTYSGPVSHQTYSDPSSSYSVHDDPPMTWTEVTIETPCECQVCGVYIDEDEDALFNPIFGYRCADITECGR